MTDDAGALAEPVEGAPSGWITLTALANPGLFMASRHPWTVGGALTSAAALTLLSGQHGMLGITLAWCMAQTGLNAMQAGIAARVPDRGPIAPRGAVSGWISIPQAVGVLIAVVLVTRVVAGNGGYVLLAGLALPFVLSTPDAMLPREERHSFSWREFAGSFLLMPSSYHDLCWVWLTRFLMILGNSMAVLYLALPAVVRAGQDPARRTFALSLTRRRRSSIYAHAA